MKPLKPIISPKIYFPGLISIIVLPIAAYYYVAVYNAKYLMPVNWYNKQAVERLSNSYHQTIDLEKFRKYKTLYLTGAETDDKLVLDTLQQTVPFTATRFGLKNGICVYLTSKAKCQNIVTALDVCRHYKTLSVIPFSDKIFVFRYNEAGDLLWEPKNVKLPPDKNTKLLLLDLPEPPVDFTATAISWCKSFWPCLIPFVGMIYFWRKRNKWDFETSSNNYQANL
ncbi:MAG TPA: hypothetical protein VHB54_18920 [Mucilaginibacter sp.]|nr:hypothetical protein [Mucilaginibacter sp.]